MPATPVIIPHREMQAHQVEGGARPLCRAIPEFTRWYGAWWMITADGWLRVTDTAIARSLDRIRQRFDNLRDVGVGAAIEDAPDASPGQAPPEGPWPAW